MTPSRFILRFIFCCAILTIGSVALSAPRMHVNPVRNATGGNISLPYTLSDSAGNQWLIYPGGWMQHRGNTPVYSQSAAMTVNNNGLQANNNQARLDDKTGEVVMENLNPNVAGITVTRRILLDPRDGYLRYIDIFRNQSPAEQSISVQLQSNLNYGITAAQFVNEPTGKQRPIGWAAATPAGKSVAELYAGRGAKLVPTLNWQQNNNFIQAQMQITIPAGKEVAIMHIHTTATTADAGSQMLLAMKESHLLAGVPPEIRREIINFTNGSGYIGDREILRGDVTDVVELRGANGAGAGDQLKGTIKEPTLKLATFYGQIELPSDKVIGLINVGQFRPRQLIVSSDGEVFGGRLSKESIELELSSGQTTQIPLSQISRIGWRKRAAETDEPTTQPDRPTLSLRSGDRITVELPTQPIDVVTRYGLLKLMPQTIAAIAFASEDVSVHQIFLTDGSRFAGLVSGDHFEFKLAGGAGGQTVSIPAASMARLQFATPADDPDDSAATLQLSNEDLLIGSLVGQLKVDTAFDTITLNAPEIRSLSRAKDAGGSDVQIELWDNSRISGQLQEQELSCALVSGLTLNVPVMLVDQYTQPLPQPSATMIEQIKQLVGQLGADDWKQREKSEGQLVAMGPAVISIIKPMRSSVGPEAQQRIDSILRQLDVKRSKSRPGPAVDPGSPPDE